MLKSNICEICEKHIAKWECYTCGAKHCDECAEIDNKCQECNPDLIPIKVNKKKNKT